MVIDYKTTYPEMDQLIFLKKNIDEGKDMAYNSIFYVRTKK